jgi:glycosyltransferase involved in cell wall biosynthesis
VTALSVLFVCSGPEAGGAEVVLADLLRGLDHSEFRPLVACLHEGPFADRLRSVGLPVEITQAGRISDRAGGDVTVNELRQLIRRAGVRLVHCNGTNAHLYGARAAKAECVPSVYHLHDAAGLSLSLQGLVQAYALALPSSAVVTPSRFVAHSLPWAWRMAHDVHVIPNGIDSRAVVRRAVTPESPSTFRREDRPVVVWCGRLQRWKGAHVFMRAASLVAAEFPSATFVIVGGTLFGLEPEYPSELCTLAGSLGLGDRIRFVGQQPDGLPWMAAADLIVHSSIRPEPFGMTVLEAMAAGKAVIASAAGGPAEIVLPDKTGLLVTPNDPQALAAAMRRLLADPQARVRLGEAGRERAANFSVASQVERFAALYRAIAAATPAVGRKQPAA